MPDPEKYFKKWFFDRDNAIQLITLIVTALGIGVLIWQNWLIRKGNEATQSALVETRRAITNDSTFSGLSNRPFVYVKAIGSNWNKYKPTLQVLFFNGGVTPAKNLQMVACYEKATTVYGRSSGCGKGGYTGAAAVLGPHDSVSLYSPYVGEWDLRSMHDSLMNGRLRFYVYGQAQYETFIGHQNGKLKYCFFGNAIDGKWEACPFWNEIN